MAVDVARRPGALVPALVAVQLAVAGAVVAAFRADWTLAPAAVFAVVVLALVLGRRHGETIFARLRTRLLFLSRRRNPPLPGARIAAVAPLLEPLPELEVAGVPMRTGVPLGVCFDGAGWTAVLRVDLTDQLMVGAGTGPRLPLRPLVGLLEARDVPLDAVQVLAHAETGTGGVSSGWDVLVVLRLGPDQGRAAIEARGGGGRGAAGAMKSAVLRVVEEFAATGTTLRWLTPDAIPPLLATVAGVGDDAPPDGMRRTAEGWRGWRLDGGRHVTWALRVRPGRAIPFAESLDRVEVDPGGSVTGSLVLFPDDDGDVRQRVLLRVRAASGDDAGRTGAAVPGLRRLDGRQAPGFLATLPLGGAAAGAGSPGAGSPGAGSPGAGALGPADYLAGEYLRGNTQLELPFGRGGLALGRLGSGSEVGLRLLRLLPTRAVLITASYVARLVAVRALAAGAELQLSTPRPRGWAPLLTDAGGRADLLATGADPAAAVGTAEHPVLSCDENGFATVPADLGPWQASLVVLDPIVLAGAGRLPPADVLILQRLDADQVTALRAGVELPDELAEQLPLLPDDDIVVVAGGQAFRCTLEPSPAERALLGGPVRVDG